MINAVIFDMDGVLVDAKVWHYDALNMALRDFGYHISEEEHKLEYDGLPTSVKLTKLSMEKGLSEALHGQINALKQLYTIEIFKERVVPQAHIIEALSALKNDGYKLGIASNSIRDTVLTFLDYSSYRSYFSVILSNTDVSAPKPDPEIYQAACRLLNEERTACLVVEDNHNGILAATRAGTHVMQVSSSADIIYRKIKDTINRIDHGNL